MDNYNNNAKEKKFQDALVDEKDILRNIIQDFCQNLLEEEMEDHLGAKKYERTDVRQGHRNGKQLWILLMIWIILRY
ncbi:MAG: transposase [Actinomycetia bacterium]|nr:transposase [Actinomycetes bacterium]